MDLAALHVRAEHKQAFLGNWSLALYSCSLWNNAVNLEIIFRSLGFQDTDDFLLKSTKINI